MIIVGSLFGIALTITLALFGILSMDGHLRQRQGCRAELRARITGATAGRSEFRSATRE
jgi:hypothetical protein